MDKCCSVLTYQIVNKTQNDQYFSKQFNCSPEQVQEDLQKYKKAEFSLSNQRLPDLQRSKKMQPIVRRMINKNYLGTATRVKISI